MDAKYNRIKGMLWGLLVGDCLGSPAQFAAIKDREKLNKLIDDFIGICEK